MKNGSGLGKYQFEKAMYAYVEWLGWLPRMIQKSLSNDHMDNMLHCKVFVFMEKGLSISLGIFHRNWYWRI